METWFTVFDTETTGKYANIAELLEFGAIKCRFVNNALDLKSIKYTDQFFCVDNEVPADARAVNGLTREMLFKYSNGEYLEDKIDSIADFVYDPKAILVNYNSNYDMVVMRNNLARGGLEEMQYDRNIDMMPYYRNRNTNRSIKLTQARQQLLYEENLTIDQFDNLYEKLFKRNSKAHTALYDAYVTWRLLIHSIQKGSIKL
jgi:DNA polymerase III alpha subunit (gram-positive type)